MSVTIAYGLLSGIFLEEANAAFGYSFGCIQSGNGRLSKCLSCCDLEQLGGVAVVSGNLKCFHLFVNLKLF